MPVCLGADVILAAVTLQWQTALPHELRPPSHSPESIGILLVAVVRSVPVTRVILSGF